MPLPAKKSPHRILKRPRRLRSTETIRALVRETTVQVGDLILPLFVSEKIRAKTPVASMPGVFQFTVKEAAAEAAKAQGEGIRSVLLFGIPAKKDERASQAYAKNGVVQRAVRAIKKAAPNLAVITDVCLCEYMSHGHCGITEFEGGHAHVLNDESLELLAKTAVSHAAAGADIVAPSDMMDERVRAIRTALDDAGFKQTIIMSYAAKFASAFYGPFRDAAESAPKAGDRKSYQMDAANALEALREVALDIEESADIVMVKPGLPYLDVLWRVKERFGMTTAVYNVSGEYAMIKAAAKAGWLNEREAVLEMMTAFKRAGADLIVTYWAHEDSPTGSQNDEARMTNDERITKSEKRMVDYLQIPMLAASIFLAGCATAPKTTGSFPVNVGSSPQIQITNAKALVKPYGVVVTGQIHLAPNLPDATVHAVDITVTGSDGQEIRKFTSQYFPTPKAGKRKAQHAHFTMVTYSVPAPGSMIQISLTPEPTVDHPSQLVPESQ